MTRKNISEKGSFYICYRCLLFKCNSKKDMERHYQRTTPCKNSSFNSYDQITTNNFYYNQSISHRFVTEMSSNILEEHHIKTIINNFTNNYNIITFESLNSLAEDDEDIFIKNNENINNYFSKLLDNNNNNNEQKDFKCNRCLTYFTTLYKLINHSKNINICNKNIEINNAKSLSNTVL